MSKEKYNHKMPKHWKRVKKALNKAMAKEMGLKKNDKRDCIYFSLDSTLAHVIYHTLSQFKEYSEGYTEKWGDENPSKIMDDMLLFFQMYVNGDIWDKEFEPEEYKTMKKETFGKFYEYFEHLWT